MDSKKYSHTGGIRGAIRNYIGGYFTQGENGELKNGFMYILRGLGAAAASAALGMGQCAFGTYPLGLALMCASKSYVPFMYAGLMIAAMLNKGQAVPLFLTWTFAFLLRVAVCLWQGGRLHGFIISEKSEESDEEYDDGEHEQAVRMFGERLAYRICSALGGCALIAIYRIISSGFLYYDTFAGLLDLTLTPLLVLVFEGAFDKALRYTTRYEAGILALTFAGVYSLRGAHIFGFSLAVVAAFVITLAVSRAGGMLRGGIAGLVCGLACHGLGDIAVYAPILGLSGMAAGMTWKLGCAAASAVSAIVGIVGGIATCGFSALAVIAPDLLGGAVIFVPLARFNVIPESFAFGSPAAVPSKSAYTADAALQSQAATSERLESMSNAFESLSEVFYNLSDKLRRPGIIDIGRLCDSGFESYCAKCINYSVCRESELTSTNDVLAKLSRKLYRVGKIERGDVPEFLSMRCTCLDIILNSINTAHAHLIEDTIGRDKTETAAADYKAVSELLAQSAQFNETEHAIDEEGCLRLRKTAQNIGFHANNIAVYGNRRKNIIAGGVDVTRTRVDAYEIACSFGNAVGSTLCPPRYSFEGDYVTMQMSTERRFDITYAKECRAKHNEKICGDSIVLIENKEDYFYSVVSDGMGSGRDAALTSRITGIILEKMLSCGNAKSTALSLANNFIRAKNSSDETFATVDLLEIDLLSGEATFVKGGAAPSFVIRDGRLFKISSSSMPIGITRELSAEEITTPLEDGDIIVMMTDGLAQSFEEIMMLANMLSYSSSGGTPDIIPDNPDEILSRIMDYSAAHRRNDDITVAVMKVSERF